MRRTSFYKKRPHCKFIAINKNNVFRYHNLSVWECFSKISKKRSRISGPLAQILEKYPRLFELNLIAVPCFDIRRKIEQ